MEQPQTIGDDKQPDVEWDPPLTLNEKFTYQQAVRELKQFPIDAELGALLRHLPENSSLIHTPAITGFQWEVLVGDFDKPDYYTNGNTPEEALRNLFQCMAGES